MIMVVVEAPCVLKGFHANLLYGIMSQCMSYLGTPTHAIAMLTEQCFSRSLRRPILQPLPSIIQITGLCFARSHTPLQIELLLRS